MYYLAYHDTLTKLPNRLHFEMYLQSIMQKNFILLFIDLDRFKVINDTLGHDVGDEMLVILSTRLKTVLGQHNFLARLGGDEFIAIVEDQKNILFVE